MMKKLTFAFDCQLNDQEDYVKEGQEVEIYPHVLNKEGFTPVLINKAFSFEGKEITINQYEWFTNTSFKELRR